MSKKENQVSVPLDAEVRARLEAAAAADRRPLASLIRNVLADWVDSRPVDNRPRAA
jgi:hypothetical protein